MIEELIRELKALDLMTTELEGEDWCIAADKALSRAAAELEELNAFLKKIAKFAQANRKSLQ